MYRVLQLVGEGSFGRVYKAKNRVTGQIVALKCIAKVGLSKKELQNLKKEIEIMRGLNHPNIIQLFNSFETETEVVIVTEFAEGQLFQILKDNETLLESQVQLIACQLISALYYLHSHRILHRDMKTQNVLLMKNGVVKLCDFGLARAMSVSTLVLTSIKGTPLYMSPELMEEKPYDHTADLWSLGCILYELHTGTPPFNAQSIFHLLQCIVKDPVKWPDNMSDVCRSFLQGLLTKDPQKRLSWPHLLDHPFVAGDVLVLSDTNRSNALTVTPAPDMVALKNQQAGAKALVTSGESRSLQKARKQKKNSKKVKAVGRLGVKMKDGVKSGRTVSVMTSESTSAMSQGRKDRGQINTDGEQDFIGKAAQESDICDVTNGFFDAEYWEELDRESEPSWQQRELSDHTNIISQIRSKLMAFKAQLVDGVVEEDIQKPLKVLRNLILSSDPKTLYLIGQNLELPHVLFHLVHNAVEKSSFLKQPRSVAALGEILVVLRVYLEKHRGWVEEEPKLEELCKPFSIILSQPNLLALAPVAASILSLFIQHNVGVRVDTDNVTFLLKALLSDTYEPQVPLLPGWGVYDGLLYLLQHTLSENDSGASRLDPVMLHLWKVIGASLAKATPYTDLCSANGLHSFLSTTLSMYSQDPYSCVPLFSKCESKCVFTLGQLLGTDCLHLFAAGGPEHLEVHVSHNSVSLLSCQLLCFPFALDLPSHTMSTILQVYDSCDIATSLLQVIQTFPCHQLELPLSLLSHLLLCNLDRTVSHLEKAAHGFFASKPETPFSRTAFSLLCDLLQRVEMWDSAVELLTLMSHVACCSHGQSCIKLHLESSVLHQALVHSYCKVKAAACRLLGNLEPFSPVTLCPPQTDFFKHVIDSLHHPCVSVRRAACRTVAIWLRYVAVGDLAIEEGVDEGEKHRWTEEARRTVTILKPLITDPDPLIRRHCCAALGNLLYIDGAASLLLDEDITNLLMKVACTDNHHVVRQAAIATLSLYVRCEPTRQVLISLDAGRKFVEASRHAPAHCDYNQLIERL